MTHISNRDLMFQPFTLNDENVIELLIEFRYKYDDNLFLGGNNVLDVTGVKAINQEVVATYASLERLIKQCNFSEQQLTLLKMVEQGYTHREIADVVKIEQNNIARTLKTIYKTIAKENERQWRKSIYVNTLGLKTKQCNKCKENLPATHEFFAEKKDSKDLLHPYCRKCKK